MKTPVKRSQAAPIIHLITYGLWSNVALDLLQVSLSLSYRSTIGYITWRSTEGRSEKERLVNRKCKTCFNSFLSVFICIDLAHVNNMSSIIVNNTERNWRKIIQASLAFSVQFWTEFSEVDKSLFLAPPLRTTSCNVPYSGSIWQWKRDLEQV
jgi:hypothetical protein